jgi:endo-1,4-beta-xylanase
MHSPVRAGKPGARSHRFASLFTLPLALLLFAAAPAWTQTIQTYGFEDGTADGWTSFFNASTPVNTNLAAHSGSDSLSTTTSSTGTGGPSILLNGLVQAGGKYTITGWVMLASGESAANANFTIRRTDPTCSGGTCFDTVGAFQVGVTDTGWAQIGGSYTAPTTETGLQLYAQLVGATTAQTFYLDDVTITQTAPPPGGTPVATYTFSDGGLDGWAPFGSPTLTNAAPPVQDPNGDALSLLTTNRTATFMGPSLNLLSVNNVVAGALYQVTAYVLLAAPDAGNPTATLSIKTADCATTGSFTTVGTTGALSSTAWTKVQGTFSFSDQPGPPTSLLLYMQSSSATDSFYIGDVVISELAPAPPSVSEQDNSGITTTFADGGLDGWSSRSGSSKLTNAAPPVDDPNGDAHALLVTGRTANFDGPQISVSDKMYVGSVYNISGWVMLTPADGSSHVINMSLQTTVDGNTSFPSITPYPGVTVLADGQWHQINVMGYTMASPYDQGEASLYFQTVPPSGNDLVSFYLSDFQLSYVAPPSIQTNIPSIFKTFTHDFHVGAAVDPTDLAGPHEQLLTMHFDSITSGNDMKWSSVEPSLGTYNFATADSEVGVAVCHNILVRGHNLVWATGAQTPAYAFGDGTNSAANQATVIANIQEHIKSEVQHFGTQVYAWDVVNEPLDPSQPDCLAHGPFYQVLGKSYIDVALKAARQYAPKGTQLFINDYSTTDANRLACLVSVVSDLRSRGIPLDGVGHEMHNAINYPPVSAMENAIDTMHEKFPDLKQQVTELDMSVYNAGDTKSNYGNNIPPAVLAEQGWLYADYFDLFRRERNKLESVTFWGMADDDTWLDGFPVVRTDYPLPFDHSLQAKPAYWGIVNPRELPGFGLHFSASTKTTGRNTRTLTLTATNGDVGPAYTTQISSVSLKPIFDPKCSVTVTTPASYPIALGDIATRSSARATFNVTLTGCRAGTWFVLTAPWTSATYETGTLIRIVDLEGGSRDK